ncbi:MAG: hypothetical protein ACXACX_22160 [Candidatus Hodarchaeales archaeon]|jgi:hypothetical protein
MVYKKNTNSQESVQNTIDLKGNILKSSESLEGKTLKVYWYLLTNGTRGIRDIQKDLDFSSPSTAQYQVKKLIEAGIVSKDGENDKYFVKQEVKTGILGFYIRFGYKMIPRFTIYLILHFLGLLTFIGLFLIIGVDFLFQPITFLFLIYFVSVTMVFVFESYKIWKMKPD